METSGITPSRYESDTLLNEYLHFHYGSESKSLPLIFKKALYFPVRCVTECVDTQSLSEDSKALDLGCAVGRSSFELTRICKEVYGVDLSENFIAAAKQIQEKGQIPYTTLEEGAQKKARVAKRPAGVNPFSIQFRCADAMTIVKEKKTFDVILAANLICRLPIPKEFLQGLTNIAAPKAQLILVSPYSWLEDFTPRQNWLGGGDSGKKPLQVIQSILEKEFELQKTLDLPFLIREHARKFQLGISQATIWRKK